MNTGRLEVVDPYFHSDPLLVYSPTNLPGRGADLAAFCEQYQGCTCTNCQSGTCSCLMLSEQLSQTTPFPGTSFSSSDGPGESLSQEDEATGDEGGPSSSLCYANPDTNDSSKISTSNDQQTCRESSAESLLPSVPAKDDWISKIAVLECNSECSCSLSCPNRVVQRGPLRGLEVFTTKKKGLGLRTTSAIKRGTFTCEYAGEVLGLQQAKERLNAQSPEDMNYIFVLKEYMKWKQCTVTVIDPTMIGNIGRYINHSCDPNLSPVPVRVDQPVPKLALFANRDIEPYEELSFDYSGGEDAFPTNSTRSCCCESPKCKGYLPVSHDLFLDIRDSPE